MTQHICPLSHRTVLRLTGPERTDFLNGLVTNTVEAAQPGKAVHAGLLTPQGKFLFDMLIFADADALWLDVETELKDDLARRLTMYKLRADVSIEDLSSTHHVFAASQAIESPIAAPDPRHGALGWRVIAETAPAGDSWSFEDWDKARIQAGVPDGSRDVMREKYFWPETNAEALHGTSYTKGCYVGQELVSRLKHRSEVKRLILPAKITGGAPEHGTDIVTDTGRSVGSILTSAGDDALIYLRLEHKEAALSADGKPVHL